MLSYHQKFTKSHDNPKKYLSRMHKSILSSVSINQSRHVIEHMAKEASEKSRQSNDKIHHVKCLLTLLGFFFEQKDDSQWTQVKKTNHRMHFQRVMKQMLDKSTKIAVTCPEQLQVIHASMASDSDA